MVGSGPSVVLPAGLPITVVRTQHKCCKDATPVFDKRIIVVIRGKKYYNKL